MVDHDEALAAQADAAMTDRIGSLVDALYADDGAETPEEAQEAPEEVEDAGALDEGDDADEPQEDAEEPDEADDADPDGDEEDTGEPEATVGDEDRLTLRRAGYSEDDIAEMTPALASRLAEKAREEKRAGDREYQEYLAQKRKAEDHETERPEAGEQPQPSQPNLPDLAALSQPFADDLGVEPEQLTKFAEAITNAARAPMQEQLQQLASLNQRAVEAAEEALVDSAVSRLSGEFPQLRNSEDLGQLVADATAILASKKEPAKGSFTDRLVAALRPLCVDKFIDEKVKREVDRKDKQRQRGRQRAKGQPTSAARRGGQHADPDAAFRAEAAKLMDEAGI